MRNKHRRAFKFKLRLNRYPLPPMIDINYHSIDINSAFEDWRYFRDNPQENKFLRQAFTGEFSNPSIKFVLVRRGLTKVGLTIEQTKRLEDPAYFRKVSGE